MIVLETLPEPPAARTKYLLLCKDIKSTHGITWFRDSGEIVNHLFPDGLIGDGNRRNGLRLTRVVRGKYPLDLIGDPYASIDTSQNIEVADPEDLDGSVCGNRENKRIKFKKRYNRDKKLALRASVPPGFKEIKKFKI